MKALITIEQVVDSFLNERDEKSLENYRRYLRIIVEGYTDLNINLVRIPKPYHAVVNSNNMVKLPPDYIDYIKIGVLYEGKIWTLTENKSIAFNSETINAIEIRDETGEIEVPVWQDYTAGGGINFGEYRIDIANRRIIFYGNMKGMEIYIEYVSSGIVLSEKTYVPRDMLPLLKSYLNWIITENNQKAGINSKLRTAELYNHQYARYVQRKSSFTISELLDAIRSGYSMGPKA